jgi:hypothetical protein
MSEEWSPQASDIARWGDYRIDDIVKIENPFVMAMAVQSWLAAREERDENTVKLKLVDSDEQRVTFDYVLAGKRFTIDKTNGRNVRPKVALDLIRMYGPHGKYRGRDQASGFDEMGWVSWQATDEIRSRAYAKVMQRQKHWETGEPNFINCYLTHVLPSDEEEAEPAAEAA